MVLSFVKSGTWSLTRIQIVKTIIWNREHGFFWIESAY